jgi:hypothetical protein
MDGGIAKSKETSQKKEWYDTKKKIIRGRGVHDGNRNHKSET